MTLTATTAFALPLEEGQGRALFAVDPVGSYRPYEADDLELALSPLTQGLVQTGSNRFRRSAEPLGFGSPDPVSNKHRFRVRRIKLCYGGFYC